MGGDPSRLGQVQAFLRVVDRDLGTALDFDQPGGADTSWQRIYYCLRSGYHDEALQASFLLWATVCSKALPHDSPYAQAANLCHDFEVQSVSHIHGQMLSDTEVSDLLRRECKRSDELGWLIRVG
jgi:hypothetical protein